MSILGWYKDALAMTGKIQVPRSRNYKKETNGNYNWKSRQNKM